MRLSRATVVAFILLALAAAPVAAARPSQSDAGRAEHERIVRFWTPQRMAAAKPRDFVRTSTGFKPLKRPGTGGGGTTVTGASWTKSGTVVNAVGKVYFTLGANAYQCSGAVASDGRTEYSLVLTAAHCLFDEKNRQFATNWIFIPAWGSSPVGFRGVNCAEYGGTTHGCWTATSLVVHKGYADAGSFNRQATTHDFAFAVVGPGGKPGESKQLDSTVGTFTLNVNSNSKSTQVYAFGYPAAGKYNGNTLTYCAGKTIEDSWNANLTWGLACDMTGGSSGGPWLATFSEGTGSGVLGSVNSYRYSGVNNMYGPKFNSKTTAVYNAANSATDDDVIVP